MGQQETVTVAGSALRRMILVLAAAALMAAMLVSSALPVFADATANGNNCLGSLASGVPKGTQGDNLDDQALLGIRDDVVLATTDTTANCGNNP